MRTLYRHEADRWTTEGPKIDAPENLEAVRRVLEEQGPVIVEHWHYRGSRAPDRLVFDEYEEFARYLEQQCVAGDAVHVWDYAALCRDDNHLVYGKCPDENGQVPRGGAY
jgi:hypothetical protein